MFHEVRKCICGVVLRGTYMQAQKCTMDAFCDLDVNWKSQGIAIEIKIRLESLSWARNRCTLCSLKKKFCLLPFSSLKLCPVTILRWPSHPVSLRCFQSTVGASDSWPFCKFAGSLRGLWLPSGWSPKTAPQMSAPDKRGVWGGRRPILGPAGGCGRRAAAHAGSSSFLFFGQVWGRLLLLFEDSFFTATVSWQ